MAQRGGVPPEMVTAIRTACQRLPEVGEQTAWVGVRWEVRARTFAHALVIDQGWPPAYARAAGTDGPVTVLMLRGEELSVLRHNGEPFFAPPWRADEVGLTLPPDADAVDWDEVADLLAESYCAQAPASLARLVAGATT